MNLERVHFGGVTANEIFQMGCKSPSLEAIKVGEVIYANDNEVDSFEQGSTGSQNKLPAWNRERDKLPRAGKVTIYVDNEVYLTFNNQMGSGRDELRFDASQTARIWPSKICLIAIF